MVEALLVKGQQQKTDRVQQGSTNNSINTLPLGSNCFLTPAKHDDISQWLDNFASDTASTISTSISSKSIGSQKRQRIVVLDCGHQLHAFEEKTSKGKYKRSRCYRCKGNTYYYCLTLFETRNIKKAICLECAKTRCLHC